MGAALCWNPAGGEKEWALCWNPAGGEKERALCWNPAGGEKEWALCRRPAGGEKPGPQSGQIGAEVREAVVFYGLRLLPVCAAVLTFVAVYVPCRRGDPQKRILSTYRELSGFLKKRERDGGWYGKKARWLSQNGGTFHYGSRMTPVRFLAVRLGFGAAGMAVMGRISWEYGLASCVFLYFLPVLLLVYLNNRDNEKLLPELKLIYHAMEIQIRAGIYVTDALVECCGSVREKRLHTALMELAGDIALRADIYEALDKFQGKFDNRYIDTLCVTVLQALESGQALELLGDIGEQIKDMEETVLERKKGALDRSITFYQLGILAVVLGIALYACVSHMFGAAAGF